jgi:hypothetical protein
MRVSRLVAVLALAVFVACVPTSRPAVTPSEPTGTADSSPSDSVPTSEPSLPADPSGEPTITPTSPPSDEPVEPSPSESAGPAAAAACSGSDKNREFFEAAASALDWTVYCAVLPSGWFVDTGGYRQAGGGRLEITYRGPGGARLELHEGAFCPDRDGCVPSGTEAGDAALGDQTGALIATDDGGWAIVVERAAPISWLAVGTGLGENAFRAIADGLTVVDG